MDLHVNANIHIYADTQITTKAAKSGATVVTIGDDSYVNLFLGHTPDQAKAILNSLIEKFQVALGELTFDETPAEFSADAL